MVTAFSSATEIAREIRVGAVSPVEIAELYLDRIDRLNPAINAIVWIDPDATLAEARQAERAVRAGTPLGLLHGIPVPIKDLTAAAGQPCFYGSLGTNTAVQTQDDLIVGALRRAGCVLLGRSHAPEAGTMSVTETSRFGVARNPWDLSRSPAGSSGGAGAALAAGLAPFTHASDGGGSIRMPASSNGLVGLKPSRGRVPSAVAGWEHAATEGAEARTVADAATILDAISGPDPFVMYNAPRPERPFATEVGRPQEPLRIGLLLEAPTGLPVDDECVRAATGTAAFLEAMGHVVTPVTPRFYSERAVLGYVTHIMDASVAAMPYLWPELAEPYLRHRMARAGRASAVDYVQSAMLIQAETYDIVSQFGRDFDVLLTPTMATVPVPAGELVAEANEHPDLPRVREGRMVSFTSWVNLAGLPAISLPMHVAADGLPIGAQLVAGPWREDVLLRLAAALEEAAPWVHRRPAGFEV
ncbi:amidase [Microbacterium azadirachtae]|uniref:Acylamidase n=1 Tax=Microbacterium azadirachtae TaxID=582680 RepID=A0A0F0LJM7_9MICO|nr:amidase [Microbacterium azadirachtae]KJL31721.1 Acylamidase [Microbacterium azadirachtae]